MAVNWVRFPWCSAGPTSGDVISSNISRNHSTIPFSALLCKVQQCFTMLYNSRPPTLLCNLQLHMNVALSKAKTSAYISDQIFLHTLTIFELKWAVSGYSKAVLVSTKLCWSHNSIFPKAAAWPWSLNQRESPSWWELLASGSIGGWLCLVVLVGTSCARCALGACSLLCWLCYSNGSHWEQGIRGEDGLKAYWSPSPAVL